MVGTYRETQKGLLQGIRARLGRPPLDVLTNEVLYEHLLDEEEHMNTKLKLTSQKWITRSFEVTVDPQNYKRVEISSKDPTFGRPDIVETVDNGAPDFRRREIDVIDLQDIDLHWTGYKPLQGDTNYPHNARKVAFYYDEATKITYAYFVPPPFAQATYRIWHQPASTVPARLAEKPGFPLTLFYNLVKVSTARRLLGILAISLKKHQMWDAEVFGALKQALDEAYMDFNEPFERYILQDSEDQAGYIQPFNQSRRPSYDSEY